MPIHLLNDRYNLKEELPSGGMSTVYKAIDIETGDSVAVKIFNNAEWNLSQLEESFYRELEALQNLNHPNIVTLLDLGETGQHELFLVLELMDHDLTQEKVIRSKSKDNYFLGWDSFWENYGKSILDALVFCHRHKLHITHRDIKPENILISKHTGLNVKVADFGICKIKNAATSHNSLGRSLTLKNLSSPPFGPPEGERSGYAFARDIFSFGALCVWAMYDKPITTHEELWHLFDHKLIEGVPQKVLEILRQAVDADPSRRHASVGLLQHELETVSSRRQAKFKKLPACEFLAIQKVVDAVQGFLEVDDIDEAYAWIQSELNSEIAIVERAIFKRGTNEEEHPEETYFIAGDEASFQIQRNIFQANEIAIVNVVFPKQFQLQRIREENPSCPIAFSVKKEPNQITGDHALRLIEETLVAFESDQLIEKAKLSKFRTVDDWIQILDSLEAFEKEKIRSVNYHARDIDGRLVRFYTDDELDDVEIDQPRFVETADQFLNGTVWNVEPGFVEVHFPNLSRVSVPGAGKLKFDIRGFKENIRRQKEALEKIRSGICTNSDLRELLTKPMSAKAISTEFKFDNAKLSTPLDECR